MPLFNQCIVCKDKTTILDTKSVCLALGSLTSPSRVLFAEAYRIHMAAEVDSVVCDVIIGDNGRQNTYCLGCYN